MKFDGFTLTWGIILSFIVGYEIAVYRKTGKMGL
jgi:hypothetical protein